MPELSRLVRRAALLAWTPLLVGAACDRAQAADRATAAGKAASATAAAGSAAASASDTLSDSALVAKADQGRLRGGADKMWVVMISDFQCPYCKQWHDSSMARLEKDYIAPGKIRFGYLHLPLASIHKHARAEAEASLCASAQGKFWPYSEALFAAQPTVGTMSDVTPLLNRFARELALDTAEFRRCRGTKAIASLVNSDIAQATQAKVQSTPTFIIGDFLIQGALPYADFRKAIDTALIMARTKGGR